MKTLTKQIPLCTPGELLEEEFLKPMQITAYRLAKDIHVPATRIHAILREGRSITADTALRLERYFGLSEGYFLRLQAEYDIRKAKRESGHRIAEEVVPLVG
ncbi:MAG: HigA family addiction module antitoxin [Verrucomicrobia bacterium]|nr:HigA family addiction module antitoxin [Verrucomicrobiota bacterium]MDA1065257.1 HigA family addiction module antitoxin [Verrucomicrobiota bacterium]